MKCFSIIADAVFLTRPVLLIPVWGFSVLGYGRAMSLRDGRVPVWSASAGDVQALGGMICFSLTVAAVYVLNQLADRTVDADNPGFSLLGAGAVSPVLGWVVGVALGIGSLIVLGFLDTRLAVAGAISIIIGLLYSFRPVAMSGRPGFDFLANAAGYGAVAFGAGWVLAPGHGSAASCALAAVPYMLLMCAGSISSTLPDISGDARHGKRTTAVCLGAPRAHLLAAFFLIAAAVGAGMGRDWIALACAGGGIPLYVAYVFIKNQRLQEATYKIGGGVVMLVAIAVIPWLAVVAGATVAATYVYFRLRFNVAYPSLLPARMVSAPDQKGVV